MSLTLKDARDLASRYKGAANRHCLTHAAAGWIAGQGSNVYVAVEVLLCLLACNNCNAEGKPQLQADTSTQEDAMCHCQPHCLSLLQEKIPTKAQ